MNSAISPSLARTEAAVLTVSQRSQLREMCLSLLHAQDQEDMLLRKILSNLRRNPTASLKETDWKGSTERKLQSSYVLELEQQLQVVTRERDELRTELRELREIAEKNFLNESTRKLIEEANHELQKCNMTIASSLGGLE